jgi:Nuclear pore protein 84 / 107
MCCMSITDTACHWPRPWRRTSAPQATSAAKPWRGYERLCRLVSSRRKIRTPAHGAHRVCSPSSAPAGTVNTARVCRQAASFQVDSATATEDERLLRAVYCLLRAGCEQDAMELCTMSSSAWRAATLSACGWALLPVGADSPMARALLSERARQAALAADVLSMRSDAAAAAPGCAASASARRQRWRSACAAAAGAAARRAAPGSAEGAAAAWEQALYGVLAGSAQDCAAVCGGWRDTLWVGARAVLQCEPEKRLRAVATAAGAAPPKPRTRPWHSQPLLDAPLQLPSLPEACAGQDPGRHLQARAAAAVLSLPGEAVSGRCVRESVRVVQALVERADDDDGAPLHDRIQRLLILAALRPLCTMADTDVHAEHPLLQLMQLLLQRSRLPAAPAVRNHRIRFAAHLGLALVSLGAMPREPGAPSPHMHARRVLQQRPAASTCTVQGRPRSCGTSSWTLCRGACWRWPTAQCMSTWTTSWSWRTPAATCLCRSTRACCAPRSHRPRCADALRHSCLRSQRPRLRRPTGPLLRYPQTSCRCALSTAAAPGCMATLPAAPTARHWE